MAGIVYYKSGGAVSLTGSEYTAVTPQAKTLYVQTGSNATDRLAYGLTTDTTASEYSPAINVSGTKCFIARKQTYETTRVSQYYSNDVIQSTSSITNTISSKRPQAVTTMFSNYTSFTSVLYFSRVANNMFVSGSVTYGELGETKTTTTYLVDPYDQIYVSPSIIKTWDSVSVTVVSSNFNTTVGGNGYTLSVGHIYTSGETSYNPFDYDKLYGHNSNYSYETVNLTTGRETLTTNQSYYYSFTETMTVQKDLDYAYWNARDYFGADVDCMNGWSHTSQTIYSSLWRTRSASSTTLLGTTYASTFGNYKSTYYSNGTSTLSKTYYGRWLYSATETTQKTVTSASSTLWTALGGKFLTMYNDGEQYTGNLSFRYTSMDGDTKVSFGKVSKGWSYIPSANTLYNFYWRFVRYNTKYYTSSHYFRKVTMNVTTNRVLTTRTSTYTETVDNCNV